MQNAAFKFGPCMESLNYQEKILQLKMKNQHRWIESCENMNTWKILFQIVDYP